MYINMECKQSYWEDSKPSINIENSSYHGNLIQSRKSDNASPLIPPIHDDVCKEENSIYQYCDRNFNFSANIAGGVTSEEDDYHHTSPKRKIAVTRDPMSHRIIEKRRRDRMNNCLADLSRLIPSEYLKKGRGRIEKTEIIEMAIKHMKFLQAQICTKTENCETKVDNGHHIVIADPQYSNRTEVQEPEMEAQENYKFGYQECLGETLHFLVEVEGFYPSDALCVKLMNHLQGYYKKVVQGDKIVNRSPLEHIVLPNAYEPNTTGHPSISISGIKDRTRRNSAISITRSDNDSPNENVPGTSQLREMLVGPHLNSFYTPSITPNIIPRSSPEPSSPPTSSNGSLFKFKNYIQERFSAERSNLNYLRYSTETSNCISMVENNSPTPVIVRDNKRKRDQSPIPTPSIEVKQIVDYCASDPKPVPVFALHAKGAFYVPLSIDSHLLKPFLTELNNDYDANGFSTSVGLHPVTISVNFNRPLISKPNEFTALMPNISHRSTTTLHIVPECR